MPNYAALKAELALAPYATMVDADIATALNTATFTTAVDVPISALEGYLRQNGLMSALEAYGASPPTGEPTLAVTAAREMSGMVLSPHLTIIEMSNATVAAAMTAMLGALESAGQLTAAQQTAILAMASTTQSLSQSWGFPAPLTDQDIMAARKWS